jgi:homogentisate 1,2-dioxygenase
MKKPIVFPRSEGIVSRQAHCDLPEGTYEREFGREGFFGSVSHLYHAHKPTAWVAWEGDHRPRAFDMAKGEKLTASPWEARPVFHNTHMRYRFWETSGKMDHLVTNADGDEMLFVHSGTGDLFCDFGHLTLREGDYIILPRGSKWRLEADGKMQLLMIEATGDSYSLPDKGILGEQAIFDPAILDTPTLDAAYKAQMEDNRHWPVVIKRHNRFSTMTFPHNPLDTLGWRGTNLPVRLNWRDIRPITSHRYHIPPSVHTTFLANRFVVCTFVPRPIETDPGALKIPFFHSNNDFDEIIFYHQGNFFSRDNIHPGMITLHPAGFAHGPHPGAFKVGANAARKETDEVAVMVDTRDAVEIDAAARAMEWDGYVDSWREKP